ncbi:MAG TPA: FAD-dependent oxidoreductase [Pyrinomonadaceae bacterium]|nr:FAD-dependent oxidoreductase [Chloracidobacterium sp.]MBP9936696.1 FAD-dependent oxidoreductase [Pyrinomonadaceae bacterium]MBL0239297.1 FAD-dependent oxidoreductase [Chloracidobacterium sp.]HQX56529.1 FAD-dependent oxidoreductase [Pyrinomonadaceae bacterium]HQY67671.1 FAD-dependent oxidoreductase [Pyrinomonadaceae bacterium]
MKPTDTKDPEYFHKVIDCQYACPAHTPVPEYIRLIAEGRYTEAYMINWDSNVFPGVLGRTCDRPCEPACRRGRLEQEPVAICRLKRVAADNRDDVIPYMPQGPFKPNGKKVALIGGGPASLTVARDLAPLGYEIHLFDEQKLGGGFMRSQIPAFRLPEHVLNDEVNYILRLGIHTQFEHYVDSLKGVLEKDYDAVFVGTGAPRGRDLPDLPGRQEGDANIHIGINWLGSVAFEHTEKIGRRVIVLGGGNTAMDCCRTARRLGGDDVKVIVRSPFATMKASPWEKEDAQHEDIPIIDNHVPKSFVIEDGRLVGMMFEKVEAKYDENGKRSLVPTGEDDVFYPADDVLIAVGQENSFPWIERDLGVEFDKWEMPIVDRVTFQSTLPKVFFGGDAAFGPENVITAVAHGHQAAVSIDLHCSGKNIHTERLDPFVNLISQKMGIHEWAYDSEVDPYERLIVPQTDKSITLKDRKQEVELGFDPLAGYEEAKRCLNCDVQTVFNAPKCIECDACVDICPTSCITFTANEPEAELRQHTKVPALNLTQDLYVSEPVPQTLRIMAKDEDVCLHCGLCAERCPTAAWDMQKFFYNVTKAGEHKYANLVQIQRN